MIVWQRTERLHGPHSGLARELPTLESMETGQPAGWIRGKASQLRRNIMEWETKQRTAGGTKVYLSKTPSQAVVLPREETRKIRLIPKNPIMEREQVHIRQLSTWQSRLSWFGYFEKTASRHPIRRPRGWCPESTFD